MGQGGPGARSNFRHCTRARSIKRKNRSESRVLFFSNFTNIFPIPQCFHGRFLKKKKKKECWKPTGARNAVRKYVKAQSASAKKGRKVERAKVKVRALSEN